ncbi:MAG TPA: DUF4328 domain-containing protein [Haloferula sp.]
MENPYQPPASSVEVPALPVGELKNPRKLALWAVWLYGIGTVGQLGEHLWRTLAPLRPAAPLESSPVFPPYEHDTYQIGIGPFDLLMIVSGLGAVIAYLMWKYRAATNARILDPSAMKISPTMAVGSYFIPIVFFVVPYRAMAGISRATLGNSAGVGWWWGCHVGLMIFGFVFGWHAASTGAAARPDPFTHLSMLGSVITCLISIWLVMRITRAQAARCSP